MYINKPTKIFISLLSIMTTSLIIYPSSLRAQTETASDYIIITSPTATTTNLEALLDSVGATDSDAEKITASKPVFGVNDLTNTEALLLEAKPEVLYVQKNQYRKINLASSTPITETDFLHNLNLPNGAGRGGPNYSIAIFDTGVNKNHEMLIGKVIYEICSSKNASITFNSTVVNNPDPIATATSPCPGGVTFSTATNSALPCPFSDTGTCSHGTHVAGIAAGAYHPTNSPTLTGLAPSGNIVAVSVFTLFNDPVFCDPNPTCISASDIDIIKALDHLYTRVDTLNNPDNLRALNFSLGGSDIYTTRATCTADNPAYEYYFNLFKNKNIVTFVASGNDGNSSGITAPACVTSAVAIGSTTDADVRSTFTNNDFNLIPSTIQGQTDFLSGAKKYMLDFFTPGSSIDSASSTVNTGYSSKSGTSMATPYAAGLYTSLSSIFNGTQSGYPIKTMADIITALKTTGKKIFKPANTVLYIPRMNARRASNALLAVAPTSTFANYTPSSASFSTQVTFNDDAGFTCETVNCPEAITPTPATLTQISGLACNSGLFSTTSTYSSIICTYTVNQPGSVDFLLTDSGGNTFNAINTYSIAPILQSFTTTQATATTLGTNATVTIEANFDKQLEIGSTMSITLSNGAALTLGTIANDSGSGTGKLSGIYTIGQSTLGAGVYTLNVSSVTSTNAIELSYPTRISTNTSLPAVNISPTKTILLDVKPPVISATNLKSTNTNNPNLAVTGEKIRFTITSDEPLRTNLIPVSPTYTLISNYTTPSIASLSTITSISAPPTVTSTLHTYTFDTPILASTDTGIVSLTYNLYDLYGNVVTQTALNRGTDNSWVSINPVNNFLTSGTTTYLTDVNLVASQSTIISDPNFSTIGTKARAITFDSRLSFLSAISGMTANTETNVNITKLPLTLAQNISSPMATILLNSDQTDPIKKNLIVSIPTGVSQTNQLTSSVIQQPSPITTSVSLPTGTFMAGVDIPTSLPLTFSGKIEICLFNDTSKITTSNVANIAMYSSEDGITWTIDSSISYTDKYFTGIGNSLFCFKPNHLTKFALSNITPAVPIQNVGAPSGGSGGGGGGGSPTVTIPKVTEPYVKTFCDFDITRPIKPGSNTSNNDVKLIKQALYDLKFYSSTINNNFNKTTEKSLKSFQKSMKVKETGIIDDATWYALRYAKNCQVLTPKKISENQATPNIKQSALEIPKWAGVLRINTANSQSNFVIKKLVDLAFISEKELLTIPLKDRQYKINNKVRTKIKAFQKSKGLKETGNINKPTWNKLIEN